MVTLSPTTQVENTVIHHWWRFTRRQHRMFFRLLQEKPEVLAQLPYLKRVIVTIQAERLQLLRSSFPSSAKETRGYLLSAEHYFLACLEAVQKGNLAEANMHYEKAHSEVSLLLYVFMERGIESYI
ncbi:MAG: hypothetical protein AAFV98_17115 [Chloroflexota bacterium]